MLREHDAVALDLETLGTDPGDAILSIGIVRFDMKTGHVSKTFYVSFDEEEWFERGYTYRRSTREWWSSPSLDKAREYLKRDRNTMENGLLRAQEFIQRSNTENGLWSRGYMDETMLKLALRKEFKIEDPWDYRAASDARTLMQTIRRVRPLADIEVPFLGVPHYALDDALHETKLVVKMHQYLDGSRP